MTGAIRSETPPAQFIDRAAPPRALKAQSGGLYEHYFKRMVDVIGALFVLLILAPLLALVALAIRVSLGPKVCFRQQRVGRHGAPFHILKFRSMRPDRRRVVDSYPGDERRHTHKSPDDPRHTRLGRFIRKWSLDELPQFLNVLKGEMSLVGPRPELVSVADHCGLIDHPRHRVRPGVTGLWQVSNARSALLHEDMSLDLEYIERVTFLGDVRILLKTPPAVLRARGH